MKKLVRIALCMGALFFLTACPNPPPQEADCNFVKNSLNRRVSWARLPIPLYVDDTILDIDVGDRHPDTALHVIKQAVDFWNNQFEIPVFELIGYTQQADTLATPEFDLEGRVFPDGYNAIYLVTPDVFQNANGRDEQARTSINFRGDFIYEADIFIDASETFYFEDENKSASIREVQFKSLMIHELGHALGLGHVEIPGTDSVMYPKLGYGQMRPTPVQDDNGVQLFNEKGHTALDLPEVDRASLACEYRLMQ